MPEIDLGEKRACSHCGALFFTLNQPIPKCPKCGHEARAPQHRPTSSLQKADVAGVDVVDEAADDTKQEEEFDEDTDTVALGTTTPKPAIQDEPPEDE